MTYRVTLYDENPAVMAYLETRLPRIAGAVRRHGTFWMSATVFRALPLFVQDALSFEEDSRTREELARLHCNWSR